MKEFFGLAALSLLLMSCGKPVSSGSSPNHIRMRPATRESMGRILGNYQSSCSEWKGGDYHTDPDHLVYAIARFNFEENGAYSQNVSFYRDGDCRIGISELKTSGALGFQVGSSLLYFKHHFSEFRVMGEQRVVSYQDKRFCNHEDWTDGIWKNIYGNCIFGSRSVFAMGTTSRDSELDLYPCDNPEQTDLYCPVLRMFKLP